MNGCRWFLLGGHFNLKNLFGILCVFLVGGGGEGPMTESESVVTSISSCFSSFLGMK